MPTMKLRLPNRVHRKRTPPADETTSSDRQPTQTTILDLPTELILSICDFLPQDGRACLALTCHQMYHSQGARVFVELNDHREEKARFLQKLQNAKPDASLWLCYCCLRFHSTNQRRHDPNNFLPCAGTLGFPYCKSVYATVLDEMQHRLATPRHDWPSQMAWIEDDITAPNPLSVYITARASSTHLYLRRRHVLNFRTSPERRFNWNVSIYELLKQLESANIDICPHVCINGVWRKNDGSIMDELNKYHKESVWKHGGDFTGYYCSECRLELEVQCMEAESEVVVIAWQEVGRLAYPDGVGTDIVDYNGVAQSTEQTNQLSDQASREKVRKKNGENAGMDSKLAGQTTQRSLFPSSQKWLLQKTLNVLLKLIGLKSVPTQTGSWKKRLGSEEQKPIDLPAPASEQPAGLQSAVEMKRRWESLEKEVKVKPRLGLGCDGNEVVGVPKTVD